MFRSSDLAALLRNSRATGQPSAPPVQQEPRPARGMNGWERKYADRLAALQAAGKVLWFGYECIKLPVLDHRASGLRRRFYTPDFLIQLASGRMRCLEVKGFLREDAALKFQMAAAQHPWAEWLMVGWERGGWVARQAIGVANLELL